ncbi:hypothetical protein RJ640_003088, partial [Escallonia rubra]
MKHMPDSRKSFRRLAESIHSLLGFKTHLTSTWADSVCNVIKSLPSEGTVLLDDSSDSNNAADPEADISKIQDKLAILAANIYQLNTQRRQALNDILDLKGNIRVFCRVRPVIMEENFKHLGPVVALDSSAVLVNFAETKSKLYSFDKVFHPGSKQDEIFLEVEPVIKSALDGYNACIFAYGQTGTGKTFTMEGSSDCPGVVPRAIKALFEQAADSNHTFIFNFSMLEIYMGYLKDLLIPQTKKAALPPCLSIQTDPHGEIEIENLVAIRVSEFNQAIKLYSMIRLSMICSDATERRRIKNKLWMVDLGGSERVLKTKAWGRRFEEGKAINLSLSALGDVINALQRKRHHIPYRNSKLTQVLKDSLGEDSKTLMLVHVSPSEEDLCETVCSLNFGTRVRSIHLGKEESAEARAHKEEAMTNLQQNMKQIEDKSDEVRRDIRKLNEKLEDITRMQPSSKKPLEASYPPTEVPQIKGETLNKIGNIEAAPSQGIPRFMRDTICSRKRSGTSQQISKNTDQNTARKRRPSSYQAKSVTFPIRSISERNSGSSISRASCLVGLNGKYSADNGTEWSQDTFECDAKLDVYSVKEKSSLDSAHQTAHLSLTENHGNRKTHDFNSTKFLNVNHWLHLHRRETNSSCYKHGNKRVAAIPTPELKNRANGKKMMEKYHDDRAYDCEYNQKQHEHENIKKMGKAGIAGSCIPVSVIRTPTMLKDVTAKDSRSNSSSPSSICDSKILRHENREGHVLSTDGTTCSSFATPGTCCDKFDEKKGDNTVEGSPVQVITCKLRSSEALALNNCTFTASDVNNSINATVEDFGVSVSNSKQKPRYEKKPNEISVNSEEEGLHASAQHSGAGKKSCLYKVQSQRGSPLDKVSQKDLSAQFSALQGNIQSG